jgi:CHAT domain-containing protein
VTPEAQTALLLAGATSPAGTVHDGRNDGIVTADEIRSINLRGTQLVVLSACQTGRGEVRLGDGVYGLRRAFFAAGAETVVSSLWRVDDKETGELMGLFYQKLAVGQPRVDAMYSAMRAMRDKSRKTSHPYYWAPFVVFGRNAPLIP